MAQDFPFLHHHLLLLLLLPFLISTTLTSTLTSSLTPPSTTTPSPSSTTPSSPISSSPLDPKQLRALESLNIPTSKDPCPPLHNYSTSTTTCDSSTPFLRHLSLKLSNCSDDDVALSSSAFKSLSSTLEDLQFINCPISPIRFPTELTSNLSSFTCINGLMKLTGVWLSRLRNLTDLTVSNDVVNASGPSIILNSIRNLDSLTILHTNLSGHLPKRWHVKVTSIDLSTNQLHGKIPISLTRLENLIHLNLSFNSLQGEIPDTFGDLTSLQNVSLASNSLSGLIPDSLTAIPGLVHLDLGSNQLNGTIPGFISDMKSLKYLNLEKNNFHGVLPFNGSFIKRLVVFKVGENSNLCYNHSTLSPKVKLGIAPCDKHGLPMSPARAKDDDTGDDLSSEDDDDDDDGDDDDDDDDDEKTKHHSGPKDDDTDDDLSSEDEDEDEDEDDDGGEKKTKHHSGPNKVVLGLAIGLASIVFLIVLLVLLSKYVNDVKKVCRWFQLA